MQAPLRSALLTLVFQEVLGDAERSFWALQEFVLKAALVTTKNALICHSEVRGISGPAKKRDSSYLGMTN
jgi:hypothetical protein